MSTPDVPFIPDEMEGMRRAAHRVRYHQARREGASHQIAGHQARQYAEWVVAALRYRSYGKAPL